MDLVVRKLLFFKFKLLYKRKDQDLLLQLLRGVTLMPFLKSYMILI